MERLQRDADSVRVLHVDDEPDLAETVSAFLERENDHFSVEMATGADEGLALLADREFDCVVSDYDMPGRNGISFLEGVRDRYPDLPFILYTGKGSEEIASEAISAGVTDYLQKETGTGQYAVLANRIENAVENYRTREELEASRERLDLFFEQSPLGVIRWDENFDFARMNEAAEEILGRDEESLVGESWHAIVPESDRDEVDTVVSDLLADEGGYRSVNENVRGDGERIVCEWHNRVVTDERGDVVAIYSLFQDVTDRKRQKRRLEAVFDNTYTFVALVDPDGTVLKMNETALSFAGMSAEEAIGNPVWEADSVADRPPAREQIKTAVTQARDGEFVREEMRIDGTDREAVIDFSVRPVTDDRGEVTLLVVEGRDITEREEYVQRLETLVSNLPGVAYRCRNEPEWPMEFVRGECENLTGYPASALESGDVVWGEDILHPEDREPMWETVQQALDEDEPFEVTYRILTRDGTTKWMWERGRLVDSPDGESEVLEGFITDITDREHVAQELQETNSILRTILENLTAGILVEDADRNVLMANDTLCEMLDLALTADELIGEDCAEAARAVKDRFGHPDQFVTEIEATIQRREPVSGTEITLADGRTMERDYVPYSLPDGDANLWIYRDLTQRKEREQALERKNERLDEFASVVSHDLRSPLNVADGHLELAQESADSEHVDSARRSVQRALNLIDDLLTLAREGDAVSDRAPVDLPEIVDRARQNVETAGMTCENEAERRLLADRSRLEQLLENLLRNAGEHGGGDVTVTVGDSESGFYVADDGEGIPEDDRETVFEPGQSTTTQGTGFGLAIVKEIAEAHGWTVGVTESDSGGARFEFTDVERPE